jgi:hypothetical protein
VGVGTSLDSDVVSLSGRIAAVCPSSHMDGVQAAVGAPRHGVDSGGDIDASDDGGPLLPRALDLSAFSSVIASTYVARLIARNKGEGDHVLRWLDELRVVQRAEDAGALCRPASVIRPPSPWQRGCPEVLPGLTARPLWLRPEDDRDALPPRLAFVRDLEAHASQVRAELLALRGDAVAVTRGGSGFQQYRAPAGFTAGGRPGDPEAAEHATSALGARGTAAGDWNVLYLDLHSAGAAAVAAAANRARCPITSRLLESIPRQYGHALFSALAPHTHVSTHTGPTNKKLRCHLPLVVPGGGRCRLRAGDATVTMVEGRCLVFDDSAQHEAWNDADEPRIVLIVDVWHPDLSDEEVSLTRLSAACGSRGASACRLPLVPSPC